MTKKRKAFGTNVAQPRPFTVFVAPCGLAAVRIAKCKPFRRAREVIIGAAPVRVVSTGDGLLITGEGVVRQDGDTIRITA